MNDKEAQIETTLFLVRALPMHGGVQTEAYIQTRDSAAAERVSEYIAHKLGMVSSTTVGAIYSSQTPGATLTALRIKKGLLSYRKVSSFLRVETVIRQENSTADSSSAHGYAIRITELVRENLGQHIVVVLACDADTFAQTVRKFSGGGGSIPELVPGTVVTLTLHGAGPEWTKTVMDCHSPAKS